MDVNEGFQPLPVLVIGAGISGLLVAHQLKRAGVPYQIFDRDDEHRSRGAGWGLTLHWSLPALRELLPEELVRQLPTTYVDRVGVERGDTSRFPFYDLSTGELKGASPRMSEHERIRVSRQRLCKLLETGIDIQWNKAFEDVGHDEALHVTFKDGTKIRGRLLIGCDGSHSPIRRAMSPEGQLNTSIPIELYGFTIPVPAEEAKLIRKLDPFFLQGTSSKDNIFMYMSLLEAPSSANYDTGEFVYQICISWSRASKGTASSTSKTLSDRERVEHIHLLADSMSEPFHGFLSYLPDDTQIKHIELDDYIPNLELHRTRSIVLLGDAFHAMTMYRGEGANHAIADVLDFKNKVLPGLFKSQRPIESTRIDDYASGVVSRTVPAVLASRQACLDAHDWKRISPTSPLLTKRQMILPRNG